MRAVVQRVSRSKVTVDSETVGEIGPGLLILLGVTHADRRNEADKLLEKIVNLRIFEDNEGKMNLSLLDVGGAMLVVSQFTLFADTRRGRRPSFIRAAGGDFAKEIYDYFVSRAKKEIDKVAEGSFGAMMDVELVNDGPVTILLDTDDYKEKTL